MRLSQAHSLVLGQLVRLFAPAVAAGALLLTLRRLELAAAPVWAGSLIALLAIPTFHIGRAWWVQSRHARKAAYLGATLPPIWKGRLPGSVDVLQLVNHTFRKGFLSEFFFRFVSRAQGGALKRALYWQAIVSTRSLTSWGQRSSWMRSGPGTIVPRMQRSSR